MTAYHSTTQTTPVQPPTRVNLWRLLWVGLLTILVATIANVLIQQVAVAVLQPDPGFLPLTLMPPVIFTVAGVLGAVFAFALVVRFSSRPIRLFRRIALIVLLISFVPDLALLATGSLPGTNVANVVVLILMHVVAWAIAVMMLTRLAPE